MLGTVAIFPMPAAEDLAAQTKFVMQANGFEKRPVSPRSSLPAGIRHVVVIVKEGRSYDDILGDIATASNGATLGSAELAHLGMNGFVDGRHIRMSLRDAKITPEPPRHRPAICLQRQLLLRTGMPAWTGITGWWGRIPTRGRRVR